MSETRNEVKSNSDIRKIIEITRESFEMESLDDRIGHLYEAIDLLNGIEKAALADAWIKLLKIIQGKSGLLPDDIKQELFDCLPKQDYHEVLITKLVGLYFEVNKKEFIIKSKVEDYFRSTFVGSKMLKWLKVKEEAENITEADYKIIAVSLLVADEYICMKCFEQLSKVYDKESIIEIIIKQCTMDKSVRDKLFMCICYNQVIELNKYKELEAFKAEHLSEMDEYEKRMFPDKYREKQITYCLNLISNNKTLVALKKIEEDMKQAGILFEKVFIQVVECGNIHAAIELLNHTVLPVQSKGKALVQKVNAEAGYIKEVIDFAFEHTLENYIQISKVQNKDLQIYILERYKEYQKMGLIEDALKWMLVYGTNEYEDVQQIRDMINRFEVKSDKLNVYLGLKAYELLSHQLLDIEVTTEHVERKITFYIDELISYGLEERFLDDKFLQEQMDTNCLRGMIKYIYTHSTAEGIIKNEWSKIEATIRSNRLQENVKELEEFLGRLVQSHSNVTWFTKQVATTGYDSSVYSLIISRLLELVMKERTKVIYVENQAKKQIQEIYQGMGQTLSDPLSQLERNIYNVEEKSIKPILNNNVAKLRAKLTEIGVESVEETKNYGKVVTFDEEKHNAINAEHNVTRGYVKTLGVKVGEDILQKSQLEVLSEGTNNE